MLWWRALIWENRKHTRAHIFGYYSIENHDGYRTGYRLFYLSLSLPFFFTSPFSILSLFIAADR